MNASEDRQGSSRVEREIREILEKSDRAPTPVENLQSTLRSQTASAKVQMARTARGDFPSRFLSSGIARIGASLLLAIGAAVISDYSRLIAFLFVIASAVAFFSLWIPAGLSSPGSSPRWRGIDLRDPGPPPPIDIGPRRGPRKPRD